MNNIENRGGRPKQEYPKDKICTLRLSSGDDMLLKILVETTGKSKGEVIRDGLKSLYRELNG